MNDFAFPIIGNECNLPIYIVGVGCTVQAPICQANGYPNYQILYTAKGEGELFLNGNRYALPINTGFLIYPNVPREYYPVSDEWITHWITFEGQSAPQILENLGFPDSRLFYMYDEIVFNGLLVNMLINSKSQNPYKGFLNSSLIYNFLIELKTLTFEKMQGNKVNRMNLLQPVLDYIDKNIEKQIFLDELVDIIDVSPQYLCRLFKNCLEMRPYTYIAFRRIQEAKKLLFDTDLTIREISSKLGYNSTSYFCAIFKKLEKMSPEKFRSMHKSK